MTVDIRGADRLHDSRTAEPAFLMEDFRVGIRTRHIVLERICLENRRGGLKGFTTNHQGADHTREEVGDTPEEVVLVTTVSVGVILSGAMSEVGLNDGRTMSDDSHP